MTLPTLDIPSATAASATYVVPANFALGPSADARAVQKTRVLHVINGEHFAGAERVQDLLAMRLEDFGYDVGFACIKPGKFAGFRQSRDHALYELPMRGRLDLRPAGALARLVRQEGYALVHTHTPRTAIVGRIASALARVPMVHHVHSPMVADTTDRKRNWLNAATERLSLVGIDAVIAVSDSLGQYARGTGLRSELVSVVHNGVPTHGSLAPRRLPFGTWTLGMVALFRPRKGLEVLLEALALLKAQGLPVRLRAVGTFETANYETEIKSLARRLEVAELIEWRGFKQNVNEELAGMDLFVLPSLFGEGLPMVVLEAMAAGVPVVATSVQGVPEAIRDGVDGLLAPAGDAKALAVAIGRMIQGEADWNALRTSAHGRQAEHFSDRSMAHGVARVYDRLLHEIQTNQNRSVAEPVRVALE
jgi:glycosyltransferase involved in cell wall biosynthesis